jgi:membrane protein implicated in regulation of membrane protease activity
MSTILRVILVALVAGVGFAEPAWAYIGPGAGLSMLTAFWALLVAVFAALGFLILYPLRRFLRRRSDANPNLDQAAEADELGESRVDGRQA